MKTKLNSNRRSPIEQPSHQYRVMLSHYRWETEKTTVIYGRKATTMTVVYLFIIKNKKSREEKAPSLTSAASWSLPGTAGRKKPGALLGGWNFVMSVSTTGLPCPALPLLHWLLSLSSEAGRHRTGRAAGQVVVVLRKAAAKCNVKVSQTHPSSLPSWPGRAIEWGLLGIS